MTYEHGASQVSAATTVLLDKAGDITGSILRVGDPKSSASPSERLSALDWSITDDTEFTGASFISVFN